MYGFFPNLLYPARVLAFHKLLHLRVKIHNRENFVGSDFRIFYRRLVFCYFFYLTSNKGVTIILLIPSISGMRFSFY